MEDQDGTEHDDEDEDEHMEEVVGHERTTKHEQVLTQVVEQNDHSDEDQNDITGRYYRASDGQLLPVKVFVSRYQFILLMRKLQTFG